MPASLAALSLSPPGAIHDIVRLAVRHALREAIRWHSGGGHALKADDFVIAAVAAYCERGGERLLSPRVRTADLRAIRTAARRAFAAPIVRRFLAGACAQRVTLVGEGTSVDAYLRDRRGRLHFIGITAAADPIDAAPDADRITREIAPLVPRTVRSIGIHLHSIANGRRLQFDREAGTGASGGSVYERAS